MYVIEFNKKWLIISKINGNFLIWHKLKSIHDLKIDCVTVYPLNLKISSIFLGIRNLFNLKYKIYHFLLKDNYHINITINIVIWDYIVIIICRMIIMQIYSVIFWILCIKWLFITYSVKNKNVGWNYPWNTHIILSIIRVCNSQCPHVAYYIWYFY